MKTKDEIHRNVFLNDEKGSPASTHLNFSVSFLCKLLSYFFLTLLLFNMAVIIIRLYFGHDNLYGLTSFFDFNSENNLPTYFSSLMLFLSSCLLSVIAVTHKSNHASYRLWFVLAFIFLFLSLDEMASIHEMLSIPMRDMLHASGLLYYAWVVPYGVALVIFVISYIKLLKNLPRNIMYLFLISGTLFVLGAIGFELIGGWYYELHGKSDLNYAILYTCEESLEMLGVILFIYTLLLYMKMLAGEVRIRLND